MKTFKHYLALLITSVILQACGNSYTILDRNPGSRTIIANNYVEQLQVIAREVDNERRLMSINRLNSDIHKGDPVFSNLRASTLLYDRQYRIASMEFNRLLRDLNKHGHNYYAFTTEFPETLRSINNLRVSHRLVEQDIRAILFGLRSLIQTGNRVQLLMSIESLTGELPSDPIYDGLTGLALEALQQYFGSTTFRPKLFSYNSVLRHSENITSAAIDIVYQNLFIAQLLSEDYQGLRKTIKEIEELPFRSRSSGLEFYHTLGLFLESNPRWRQSNNELSRLLNRGD
jgi:hypothetical protein